MYGRCNLYMSSIIANMAIHPIAHMEFAVCVPVVGHDLCFWTQSFVVGQVCIQCSSTCKQAFIAVHRQHSSAMWCASCAHAVHSVYYHLLQDILDVLYPRLKEGAFWTIVVCQQYSNWLAHARLHLSHQLWTRHASLQYRHTASSSCTS